MGSPYPIFPYICKMKANIKHKNKSGVYLIRNIINGKVYIGKAKCIFKRIRQHITSLNNKISCHENQHFINAWFKYGRNNFTYIILEELPLNTKLISIKELYYIDLYQSLNPKKGYNKRYDSSTGLIVSEETRKKLSEAQIKRFKDPNERKKVSHTFWKDNPEKTKEMGIKVSNKIRKYKIGKFSYDNMELLEIFNSKRDLVSKHPEFYVQAILGCCNGDKKSYKRFKWKYISIDSNEIIDNFIK